MYMKTIIEKQKDLFAVLKDTFGYKNSMQSPRLEKVVVSVGVGSIRDKKKHEMIKARLAEITGQQPAEAVAKKSIATFKIREGDTAGYKVTLRGAQMHAFLEKLIHIVLPRTRDFRGLNAGAIDEMGNYTLGIREHTVFPETADEDVRDVFGLAITIVTTAKKKEEVEALLRGIGLPLKKEDA